MGRTQDPGEREQKTQGVRRGWLRKLDFGVISATKVNEIVHVESVDHGGVGFFCLTFSSRARHSECLSSSEASAATRTELSSSAFIATVRPRRHGRRARRRRRP